MKIVPVDLGDRSYDIVVGAQAIASLTDRLAGRRRVAIITQPNIDAAHGDAVRAALDAGGIAHETLHMGDGEEHKSLATVESLCRALSRVGVRRGDAIVALGGGVVGDVAGFTAAVHYRGVDVVQVPTTLLAMVDSAIGGKTGVNLPEGKNLVGAFHQPVSVLVDPSTLTTLPDREYRCGLGEVAKYALMDEDFVTANVDALVRRDAETVAGIVARCAAIKAEYVMADEFERTGRRAELNYGHTLAHALETTSGHALAHGEAVAIGLVFAAHLAGALERIDEARVEHHERLVRALGLPVRAPEGTRGSELIEVMARDKKSVGGLTFVLQGPNGVERVDDPDAVALSKAFGAVGVEADLMATMLVLSGPNLNLFGQREPEIYGSTTLDEMVALAQETATKLGHDLEHVQSNHEGVLIDAVHDARGRCAALIVNAGALSHYSYALADALATFDGVKVKLHVSNPHAHDDWRHVSVLTPVCTGIVAGFREHGYRLAVEAAASALEDGT